jgi:ribosomal protein S18 acetylase RimI-like enzyme
VEAARDRAYQRMRLDTLATLKEAIRLYETMGFKRIAPYNNNDNPIAVFMELQLT